MTWVLVLPYRKPPDGLSANWRGHWAVRNRSTQEVRQLVCMLARSQKIPTMQRMQVELVWIVADRRRRDGGENLGPFLKAVVDGLAADRGVTAGLTPDDTPDYVTRIMPRIEYQPGTVPHFEVLVTDTTHRPDAIDEIAESRT